MVRWIAVPVCPECGREQGMEPDEEGDYVCPICDEVVEGEEDDF